MAAPARTLSGSRFLRPKLSRFFNQVASLRPKVSRFLTAAVAALPPPLPGIFASRFLTAPQPTSAQTVNSPRTMGSTLFLRPKISRFFNQAAKVKRKLSRFMTGDAALAPPMPDIFSSRFITKPRTPPKSPLRGHWPRKPSGPKR